MHLARALAQVWEPSKERYLLLDEPTSWLDLAHQHQALQLARRFTREGGVAVAVLHDLNLAAQYADRILLLKAGRLLTCGTVREVLTPDNIRGTYGVEAAVIPHPHLDVPLIVPLAGHDLPESENPHVQPTDPRSLQSA
ncbi:Hemin import ATP-binding protein HmuV [compost metagenome]